jgi:hypothetical protein
MPHYAPSDHHSVRESLRCFFAWRLCPGLRVKHARLIPSPIMVISIRTRDTRCLISTCKIPANLPYKPRRGAPRCGHGSPAERRQRVLMGFQALSAENFR